MKKLVILISLSAVLNLQAQEFTKLWEVNTLEAPESVVYNSQTEEYYVSNVAGQPAEKNGLGYITVLDKDGQVIKQKWVSGLHAPKGMALHNDQLYIADIDRVVQVDVNTGTIQAEYIAEGATFLNDVESDGNGSIYITDTFGGNAIYKIENEEISLWLKDEMLNYPNGLKIKGESLYVSTWGVVTNPETFETEVPGVLLAVNLNDKSISKLVAPFGNLDGLQNLGNKFLVSDWIAGGLLSVDLNGNVVKLKDLNAGSADILYREDARILLVPQMMDGALTAYAVE